jgi:type I restriction enzyme S subunit
MKWPTVCLEEVATIVGGSTPLRSCDEFWNGDIPWVTPTDLPMPGEGIPALSEAAERITAEGLASCSAQLLPVGTVLFSSRATIGKLCISKVPLATNQGFANLIPKPWIDARFLGYSLQYHTPSIANLAGKTTFKEVSKGALRHYRILLPPLSEQRRIVEILNQADSLRKQRTDADAKAERILPALFYRMFGDPATNPKDWDRIPLKKLLRDNRGALQSGPFGSNLHNSDFVDEGKVFVVGIDNVHDSGFKIGKDRRITLEKYRELKKYKLEPRDVLITIMGTVGRTCVFPEWVGEAICTKHVYRVQTDQNLLDPEYLCVGIRFSPSVRVQLGSSTTGQIVDAITSKDLKELIVDVPPIDLQRQFAHHKKYLDDEAVRREDSRSKLGHLFDNLIHRAFSGNLTAKWREAHMKEIMAEMEEQSKYLAAHGIHNQRENAALQESLF